MAVCKKCGKDSEYIAKVLSLCADCIRNVDRKALTELQEIHIKSRKGFGLVTSPPTAPDGIQCELCQNNCRVSDGQYGYCSVRQNRGGHLIGGTPNGAAVSWYYDPLPTNCVADWVCPAGSGAGYPKWSYKPGTEQGFLNLAVFYQACTFNCLFCQNWHYRERSIRDNKHTAEELTEAVTKDTTCICFFGGDPTCQLPHALTTARIARKQNPDRILRICWETNGSMNQNLLNEMIDISLESGGCIKFDLKAMDPNIHFALCGTSNQRTLENFTFAARKTSERPEPPLLIASTLLVPGYIDKKEVRAIASFIARLDPDIPYALLGFHGDFLMRDLPATSFKHAQSCLEVAKASGLKRVRIGNAHILR